VRDERLPELLAQDGNVVLDDLLRRLRWVVTPELVDQPLGRDDLVRVQEQKAEQRSLASTPNRKAAPVLADFEWTEDAVVDRRVPPQKTAQTATPWTDCDRFWDESWPARRKVGPRMSRSNGDRWLKASLLTSALACGAVLLATVGGPAAPARAAGTSNSTSYSDSCTDSDQGFSPELCAVQVSNDDAGTITLVVGIPNQDTAGVFPNAKVTVELNTDANPATGCGRTGAEAALAAIGQSASVLFEFGVCKNGEFDYSSSHRGSFTGCRNCPSTGFLSFSVNRCDLGSPRAFDFSIEARQRNDDGSVIWIDLAPDSGTWHYDVVAPDTGCRQARTLSVSSFETTPKPPRAGKRFSAVLAVSTNDPLGLVSAGRVSCAGRAGSVRVAARTVLRPSADEKHVEAICTFVVPRAAHGRLLIGSVRLADGTRSVARVFSSRVR
jgi:hypothetical protein